MDFDRPRIRVDFNELAQKDLVLLSESDDVQDSNGNKIHLREGLGVAVYELNQYENGEDEYLLAEGVAELNDPNINGQWTKAAKWCCRISKSGIQHAVTASNRDGR